MFSCEKKFRKCWLRVDRLAMLTMLSAFAVSSSNAGTIYNANVTPQVIFGSDGNVNGAFTVDRNNGVEVGLRAKVRYNSSGQPENTFNSNGDGSYDFLTGQSHAPSNRLVWNFEWSINTNFDGSNDGMVGGSNLDGLEYLLEIDFDPSSSENFLSFDPINVQFADHAIGDNSTPANGGAEATTNSEYASLIGANNVAQNSWNLGFFDDAAHPLPYNVPGIYTIRLSAIPRVGGLALASTEITVNATVNASATVPEPASMLTFAGLGLCALGVRRKRRRSQVAAR